MLRHTCLRKAAEKHGVQYVLELSGQSSERYIWRYVQPSAEQIEAALEELFLELYFDSQMAGSHGKIRFTNFIGKSGYIRR